MTIARCGNQDCLVPFLPPLVYEPYASLCPCCRYDVYERVRHEDADFELITDGASDA